MTGVKRYQAFCQICGPVGSASMRESKVIQYMKSHEILDQLIISTVPLSHKCSIETYHSFSKRRV